MAVNYEERSAHRSIVERILISGELFLLSPAHFGGAEEDALTDMPVLLNEVDDRPLLPGTSIAGALRNYLREFEGGDLKPAPRKKQNRDLIEDERKLAATILFGGFRGDDDGMQSPLIVEDSVGNLSDFELRDGVSIEPSTRTAKDDQKFDMQLLGAGTSFPLQFELVIREHDSRDELLRALATALKGFEESAITMGARKRRGFGKCRVDGWKVRFYDLKTKQGLLDWLSTNRAWASKDSAKPGSIMEVLEVDRLLEDNRRRATLRATFGIDGTLLIRSGFGDLDARADTVHLHAARKGKPGGVAVIPGTSWAGILRHRALKIARTVSGDANSQHTATAFVDALFGPSEIKQKKTFDEAADPVKASRITIEESEIRHAESLEVTRVAIDRFTGGVFEGALFTEQPLVGKDDSDVELTLTLRNPKDAELGLLLLLLKDLWTGDLPLGGESGVGRGRLKGREASLRVGDREWSIREKPDGRLQISPDASALEEFVKAFNAEMEGAK
jgi:CRISPR/Cas system CSM-associated protein Csm3 (group 7 of RAMP superfamily)